ncbi:MAG: NAD(P)/FAD-dependent oxidoreductase, partial [Alphaproteobacteria bacterium]|nr:NAD(P)/FAD-dependent oxidoreductase [Alphaproteobacteria bacterium]
PFIIPIPGHDLDGVISFRDIWDVERMMDASLNHKNVVVIGGGLLGLEAANGLMVRGMNVTVIHLMDTLMERQLDVPAGKLLQASLEKRGLSIITSAQTEKIIGVTDENGAERVSSVCLKDGTVIDADLVVMAVGIRPNAALAEKAQLSCDRGVLVNDTMQTYDPCIYAVGECVQHRGQTYGLVAPLFEQAKVCANHLAQMGYSTFVGAVPSTKLKVTGIDLFSVGDFTGDDDAEEIVMQDAGLGVYKKLVIKDNKVKGAVLYGDATDSAWYMQLIRDGVDVSEIRDNLLFGPGALGDAGHGGSSVAASMTDDMEVCGCNGVCKGAIVTAIQDKGLTTLAEVRAHTKASSSCGSCTGLVEQILSLSLGDEYAAPQQATMCPCTDKTHDEVREAIVAESYKTIPEVMRKLDWQAPDGCSSCRPALNFYLLSAWPGEYVDDNQSRFINERAHANIQKDGTYSVVPRMWGGLTTPDELRAIANVADKFKIPTVKMTGGQRIDLLGVKKEDLPDVWRDLNAAGMVSGHAYGKSLRTVKTCVGSDWCRFGTQDSTGMGVTLEKMTWGSWMPHKFKIAVSGCPRNCAEATIKDFGVVAVDSGWELHVGGNGGIKVRATELLCKVVTEDEVQEYCAAYTQLYREEAHYLERTAPWMERVGLDYVKKRIVEDQAGREALRTRFLFSQRFSQTDPWAERATQGKDAHEFKPLAMVG